MNRKWVCTVAVLSFLGIAGSVFAAGPVIKKDEWLAKRTSSEQFQFDINCWHSLLFPSATLSGDEAKRQEAQRKMLGRLLLVIKYGGLKMRTSNAQVEPADDAEPTGNAPTW